MITAAQDVAHTLAALGIRQVFALCADQTNSLLDALAAAGIAVTGARQESAAVHMADGWTRATGAPCVAVVGGGPGYVNSVTGVAVSQSAATPVLVIGGQPALHTRERNGHQILYQADILRTLTKWSQEVMHPTTASEFVCRGLGIATAGKPGPVSLSIPVNVFDGDAEGSVYHPVARNWRHESGVGAGDGVAAAAALLAAASRPMMIVGGGAWWELDRPTLQEISRQLGIPVFTTELARGLVADDGENCFGYAHPSFSRTFRELKTADLIVMVGTEMNLHTGAASRGWIAKDAQIVQLHRDPAQIGIGRATDVALLGSLEASLRALARSMENLDGDARKVHGEWLQHLRSRYAYHRKEWDALARQHGDGQKGAIHPMRICTSLARHYSEEVRVVIDGGDFVHWPRLFLEAKTPGYWMDGAELGALGASLPVGIGAQLGRPASQTWVFIGDGGFGFYGFDLSTAVENGLAVKVIIGNDACWGVERRLQRKDYGRTVAVDLPEIEYHTVARGLGAQALLVDDPAQLDAAVDAMVAAKGPFVLDIRIPRDAGRPLMA